MGMKFTQVRADTFETIQINAAIILNDFDPSDGSYDKTDIIGATTGGSSFSANLETTDFGEDIDNVPGRTKQLARVQSFDPTLTTTFVTVDTALGRTLTAAADISGTDTTHIIPRNTLSDSDFGDIWLVGDYSDKNGTTNGGFVAIHIKNALNTGGFEWQTTKDGKGQFSAEFHGHYDIDDIDDIPFEVYIKAGTAEPTTTGTGA
ncbi:MAG: hypothetical protein IJH64_00555 [Oscillospiraceae bacterium]|nr:hypothetical protein [Oscillospiraceae bacterium]